MTTTEKQLTLRILEPSEGMWLTQAADVPETQRIATRKIYLALNDAAENYREITAAEADVIRRQMRAAREAEVAQQTGDRVQEPSESEDIE